MSLNRYATKRDINEPEIIAALRAVGATVFSLDKPVDLLVGYKGKTLLMEVKQYGKKKRMDGFIHDLTTGQREFFSSWRGGELVTVRSVEQALACLGIGANQTKGESG
jgi:hypothetical protein